jgi:hypothetical protein
VVKGLSWAKVGSYLKKSTKKVKRAGGVTQVREQEALSLNPSITTRRKNVACLYIVNGMYFFVSVI